MNNDKQHREFQNIDEVRAAAIEHVKHFFDDLNEMAARVEMEIAEINRQEAKNEQQ